MFRSETPREHIDGDAVDGTLPVPDPPRRSYKGFIWDRPTKKCHIPYHPWDWYSYTYNIPKPSRPHRIHVWYSHSYFPYMYHKKSTKFMDR